jgi:hypothetical protein
MKTCETLYVPAIKLKYGKQNWPRFDNTCIYYRNYSIP